MLCPDVIFADLFFCSRRCLLTGTSPLLSAFCFFCKATFLASAILRFSTSTNRRRSSNFHIDAKKFNLASCYDILFCNDYKLEPLLIHIFLSFFLFHFRLVRFFLNPLGDWRSVSFFLFPSTRQSYFFIREKKD